MPKLRRVGNALLEGGNALSQIALRMYQKQLDDEQQKEGHRLRMEAQAADNADQAEQNKLSRRNTGMSLFTQNPDIAARLARGGMTDYEGIDPRMFAPSQEEIIGKLGSKIGETKREDLPGDLLIEAQLGGEGVSKDPRPIESLMAIREEREQRLSAEELRKISEGKRFSNEELREVIGPEGATVPLGPTPTQAGQIARTTALEGDLHPEVAKANARKAGAQSYASSSGSTRGTMDVESSRLGDVKAIADAKRGPGSGLGDQGPIQARENSAKGMLQTLRTLSGEINTQGGTRQLLEGGLKWMGTFVNADNVDLMFKSIKRPLGLTLAVVIQGSRPTDRDAALFEDILPGFTTPKPVADALIEEVEKLLNESGVAAQDINAILNARPGTPIPNIKTIPNALERLIQAKKRGEGLDTGSIVDWVPGLRRPPRAGGPGRSGGPGGM